MAAALPRDPPSRMSDGTMCGCMDRTIVKDTIVVSVGFDFAVYIVALECPVPSVILQGFVSTRSPLCVRAPALCVVIPAGEGRPVSYLETEPLLLPAQLVMISG